jgi:hypothetical protein
MVTVAEIYKELGDLGLEIDKFYRIDGKLSMEPIIHVKVPEKEGVNILLKPRHYGIKECVMKIPKILSGNLLEVDCEGIYAIRGKPISYSRLPHISDAEEFFWLRRFDEGYYEKGIHYNNSNRASYNWADCIFDPKALKEIICKVAG